MGYGKLPVASGELRVHKIYPPRMAGGKKVLDVVFVQNNQKKVGEKYEDDKVVWIRMTFWEKEAENVYASIREKDTVVAQFEFWSAVYQPREGPEVRYIEGRCLVPLAVSTRWRTYPHHDQKGQAQAQAASEPADQNGADSEPPF